ncbi:MAG: NAD(P)/FAD-dependent oxidoreductase [Terriglobales bacterium]|jgi:flavin-dependent dehydrogenase
MPDKTIAIVGGGPAGALAAEKLAGSGFPVLLLEEKPAWEKPCGGGVTPKALDQYPFLADAVGDCNWVRSCELISPSGRRASFPFPRKIAVFSRRSLNGLLLDRARSAGAEIVRDRAVVITGEGGKWRIRTSGGLDIPAGYVVIAAGARNPFRVRFTHPFSAHETMVATGYYLPGRSEVMQLRFIDGLEGYIWTFPRSDHFSAGIVGKVNDAGRTTAELRRLLDGFLAEEGFALLGAQVFAHVIPAPGVHTLRNTAWCGPGWAMVGDAAGLVDPITGEGIYYALRSGDLLASAIATGRPEAYSSLLAQDMLPELETAAGFAHMFYRGTLLGQPVLERMVQLVGKSIRFRDIMADLFTGAQSYLGLKNRCYRQMLPVLWQWMTS